jgi:hypothetical protein
MQKSKTKSDVVSTLPLSPRLREIGDPRALVRSIAAQGLIHFPENNGKLTSARRSRAKPPEIPLGTLPLSEWVAAEATAAGISANAVYMRIARGKYPALRLAGKRPYSYVVAS